MKGHRTLALKPREPRIDVVVPVRVRAADRWSDGCILNVSSRGLRVRMEHPPERGSYVELRRGDYVVIGRVVWRNGSRIGLRSQDRVPVQAIVSAKALKPEAHPAPGRPPVERRRFPRTSRDARLQARTIQFASVLALGATISVAIGSLALQALADPMTRVRTALDSQASLPADSR